MSDIKEDINSRYRKRLIALLSLACICVIIIIICVICIKYTGGPDTGDTPQNSADHGWFIVKSADEMFTENPTRDNADGITELPVYKNEKGIYEKCYGSLDEIRDKIDFLSQRIVEEHTCNYSYMGEPADNYSYFPQDTSKSLEDQLFDYTFHSISFTDPHITETQDALYNYEIINPPTSEGVLYPIISEKEAEEEFRKGNFTTYGNCEIDACSTAEILSAELVYLTENYQYYIQPFYKFLITDENWDISGSMECDDNEAYLSVSEIYVPAVESQYLDEIQPQNLRVN